MPSKIKCFKDLVLAWSRDPSLSANAILPINGRELTIADVVAVSRDLAPVKLTSDSISAIYICSRVIPERLSKGDHIYSVDMRFGGSADTRSNDVKRIQQNSNGHAGESNGETSGSKKHREEKQRRASAQSSLPLNGPLPATCVPESWARASMLIRLNSLAGAIVGPRDIEGARKVIRADRAPSEASIEPISLQAKEGLAIIDGAAVSAGVAALAMHESLNLSALSQILTEMSVEALRESDESFESFIARVRPHTSQQARQPERRDATAGPLFIAHG
ncbi:hypothetical protein NPX13_g8356 [Xylaria arbuscula]|uniref:Uncharacterized protein n=1 Tax=Xylaria arbuscula TaxID=114810 RepID=A0A9W8N8W4_9PEZI|nr:hypothetical protein NPX13_g8356 [Xylaria arbuscula]